jgi:hypothetical protein
MLQVQALRGENHGTRNFPSRYIRFEFSDTLGDRSFSDVALYRNAATR